MTIFSETAKMTWLPAWSPMKWCLVVANVLFAALLLTLFNTGVLPLDSTNFFFFLFVSLLFALYRPGWAFLFLIGLLPLEIVNVAPEGLGLNVRPYQWAAVVVALALAIRIFMKRINFPFFAFRWFDGLLLLLPLGAFLALFGAPDFLEALKQALVVTSFFLLYLLFRQYLQTADDVRQTLPFFFGSGAVVLGYALWQNVRTELGREAFTVMAGRPNSSFTEADWLGMFVLFLVIVLWAVGLQKGELLEQGEKREIRKYLLGNPWPALFFVFHTGAVLILLLTVSRSAWLGVLVAAFFAALALLGTPWAAEKKRKVRRSGFFLFFLAVSFLLALAITALFRLTPFPLFDRAASTASGLQKITVACQKSGPPERIESVGELARYGCEHILLEEKEARRQAGDIIGETFRPDPNIEGRKRIYQTSLLTLREHPLLGIGWGNIGPMLGTDERGATLNASNIFLETWLGSGLLGLLGLTLFLASLFVLPLRALGEGRGERSFLLFLIAATAGLLVFNFFNSGILLGFFFLSLALGASGLASLKK